MSVMPWRMFFVRSAIGAAMVGVAVFAGVRLATAEPGGSTGDALTFAGVLNAPDGGTFAGGNRTLSFVFHKGAEECRASTEPPMTAIPVGGRFSVRVTIPMTCSRPFFDGSMITYDVLAAEESGSIASGTAITPVPYARYADQVGVNNDCPAAYELINDPAFAGDRRLCQRRRADGTVYDEVVRVGTGASAFWIDRYEATIWATAQGGGTPLSSIPPDGTPPSVGNPLPISGQGSTQIFALSVSSTQPAGRVSWFQANEACRASGKRLPTIDEWFAAGRDTPDPEVPSAGTNGTCLTMGSGPRATGQAHLAPTSGFRCISRWGVEDMIGNMSERTVEWYAGVGTPSTPNSTWGVWMSGNWVVEPGSLFRGDGTSQITSEPFPGGGSSRVGLPSAPLRGGSWRDGTEAGLYSINLALAPSIFDGPDGFRCVTPR